MRRPWRWLAISLAAAAPAGAAVVKEQTVVVEVRPDGSVRESVTLTVELDREADLDEWAHYPIFLDTNRELRQVEAWVTPPGGKPKKVPRRARDRAGIAGGGVLHSSVEAELIEFPALEVGSVLRVEHEVIERPYFPSGLLVLGGEERVDRLRVEVRGAGASFRHVVSGNAEGLTVVPSPGGVTVTGSLPAFEELERAPEPRGPVLRYAWGPGADWAAVGRWYRDLLAELPRGSAAVRDAAKGLQPADGSRERTIETMAAFARSQVRYVAVEVGVGGYRPAAPPDVMARRWGDCKDKALLLVDLLAAAGIEARVALAWAGDGVGIDASFPSPDGFDHAIVAVPTAGLKLPPEAAVADGWLLLDATQTRGGLTWLAPFVRGRHVLVVEPDGGRLVEVPPAPEAESTVVTVEAKIAADGSAAGQAELTAAGWTADWLQEQAAAGPDGLAEARTLLADRLPGGARLERVELHAPAGDGAPAASLRGTVTVPGLVPSGAPASFLLPGLPATPEPSLFDDRKEPVEVRPRVAASTWRLELPSAGCAVDGGDVEVDGKVGSFRQQAKVDGRTLVVSRRTELRRRVVAGAETAELQALSVAEHRALKKRIRLRCGGAAATP